LKHREIGGSKNNSLPFALLCLGFFVFQRR
jgi:hypothetical protein